MRLCHPADCLVSLTARGYVAKAECHAPGCGRVYGYFIRHANRGKAAYVRQTYLRADTWASWTAVLRLVNEMRCQDDHYCRACDEGRPLSACEGAHG